MARYKDIEEKIDEALKLSKNSGKEYGFNICMSDGKITTTNIEEDKNIINSENKCPGTKLGSFNIHPENTDALPSPNNIPDIQPNVQKV
jgi:hypothetical protein